MWVQCPASASSTALSMISQTQCMSPRESVDPTYMPGRLRTASSPSRTDRCRAVYAPVALLLAGAFSAGWAVISRRRLPPESDGAVSWRVLVPS